MSLLLVLWCCIQGEIEPVPSPHFPASLQQRAVCATVRIVNQNGGHRGTGVILRTSGPFVYILTADHLLNPGGKFEVSTFSESSYPRPNNIYFNAEVMARDRDLDVALLRLPTRDRMPASLPICPPAQTPKDEPFPVMTVGCSKGDSPTCLLDKVIAQKHVRKHPTSGISHVYELGNQQAPGRSGGPLLDARGQIIGICSGVTDRKGYFCHIEEIHRWLKRHNLQWLYDEEKK